MNQIYQGKQLDNPSCLYAWSVTFTYSQFGLPLFFNSTLMDVISPCGHILFLPLNDSMIGPPSSHVLSLGCFLQHARKLMNHFMAFTYSKNSRFRNAYQLEFHAFILEYKGRITYTSYNENSLFKISSRILQQYL
jgi:hypothetical protein